MSQQRWAEMRLPAITVPAALSLPLAQEIADAATFDRYARLDRGSYDVATFTDEGLLEIVRGIASEVTGRTLSVASARLLRLLPGDYLLLRNDRTYEGRPIEVVLDLSPRPVGGAEVHYRHRGQVYFVFPSAPGAMAIVERGPTVTRNHTYVSRRGADPVVRLEVLLS